MEEKRGFLRLKRSVNIKWAKAKEGVSQAEDITMDVSKGGVCFIAYEKLPVGEELNLEIELPSAKTITSKAKVAWVREFEIIGGRIEKGYEVGVQFVDISPQDIEEIDRFTAK
jgi:c-di-GMP-binding flagellar brake protein YcgR